jgi:hypothetical protein
VFQPALFTRFRPALGTGLSTEGEGRGDCPEAPRPFRRPVPLGRAPLYLSRGVSHCRQEIPISVWDKTSKFHAYNAERHSGGEPATGVGTHHRTRRHWWLARGPPAGSRGGTAALRRRSAFLHRRAPCPPQFSCMLSHARARPGIDTAACGGALRPRRGGRATVPAATCLRGAPDARRTPHAAARAKLRRDSAPRAVPFRCPNRIWQTSLSRATPTAGAGRDPAKSRLDTAAAPSIG